MRLRLYKVQRSALYLYLFSLNFEVFNLLGLGSTARLTGLIYLLSLSPNLQVYLKTSYTKKFFNPLVFLWLFLSLMSLLNIDSSSSGIFDMTLLINILLFAVLVNHERKDPGVLKKGLIAFALGSVLLTVLYNMGMGIEYSGNRVSIFGDNENAIAVRLSMAMILLLYLVVTNQDQWGKWRFLLLVPVPSMLYFMFETGSRKGLIAFGLSFLLGALLLKTGYKVKKIFSFAVAAMAFMYIILLVQDSEVMMARIEETTEEQSIGAREEIWLSIMPLIKENIVWGVGQTGYDSYSSKVFGGDRSPHNVLIEVAAYTGIIGLGTYLYFLYLVARRALQSYKVLGILLPLLLMIPVFGLILAGQALNIKIVWAIFAFAVGTAYHSKKISTYHPKSGNYFRVK